MFVMVPTDKYSESDYTNFILEMVGFYAVSVLKELTVTLLLQYIAVICLNHAVMPSAIRVFSQLFSYKIFLFFSRFSCYVHFRLLLSSNSNSPSGKCSRSHLCK